MKTRSLRLPDDLDAALTAAAGDEHITVQARIIQALERDLATRGQYRDGDHATRIAAALEKIHGRRGPGYTEAMQAAEDAAVRREAGGRRDRKAS